MNTIDFKNPPVWFIVAFIGGCLALCMVLEQYYPTRPSKPGGYESAWRQLHHTPPSAGPIRGL